MLPLNGGTSHSPSSFTSTVSIWESNIIAFFPSPILPTTLPIESTEISSYPISFIFFSMNSIISSSSPVTLFILTRCCVKSISSVSTFGVSKLNFFICSLLIYQSKLVTIKTKFAIFSSNSQLLLLKNHAGLQTDNV